MIEARTWESLLESDEVALDRLFEKTLVQLAATQAIESSSPDDEPPSFDDARETFAQVCSGARPPWWPPKVDRILVTVLLDPVGKTTERLGPSPVDPNGKELGRRIFRSTVLNLLESGGNSFDGEVGIRLQRASDKQAIGGWRGEVFVGEKKKRGRRGEGGKDDRDETLGYLTEQLENRDKALLAAMHANTAGMHGAAAVINATRGVNAAPPWMQEGDQSSMPMWMAMAQAAFGIIGNVAGGKPPASAIKELMSNQVQHPMLPSSTPQLTDRGPPPTTYGEDQFGSEGEYDGYRVEEDDLLDDEFDSEDDDDFDDEVDEVDDEEEAPRSRRKKGGRENPLEGANPEDVERWMNNYIDRHPEKRAQMLKVGTRLASKLMGGG